MEALRDKRILIVHHDPGRARQLQGLLQEQGYAALTAQSGAEALDLTYAEPPDLVIVSQDLPDTGGERLCRELRGETLFGHLPVLLLLSPGQTAHSMLRENLPLDDVLREPLDGDELLMRIALAFSRMSRTLDANPLTRLPGNNTIIHEVQNRLNGGEIFALAYADLDHFKGYNDRYGFGRGDEVIRMTARILTNVVRRLCGGGAFVGHIGGDDFVFLASPAGAERACPEILHHFDLVVASFYDAEDREARAIETRDRSGRAVRHPLMSHSIAVVTNEKRRFSHFGECSAVAAELKKYAKSFDGSVWVKDRRRA